MEAKTCRQDLDEDQESYIESSNHYKSTYLTKKKKKE